MTLTFPPTSFTTMPTPFPMAMVPVRSVPNEITLHRDPIGRAAETDTAESIVGTIARNDVPRLASCHRLLRTPLQS